MKKKNEISSFRLLLFFNGSKYLILVLIAGFLWGLLPLGYSQLNSVDLIRQNPFMTVAVRFFCATVIIGSLLLVTSLISKLVNRKKDNPNSFYNIIKNSFSRLKSKSIYSFIGLAALCYCLGRALEMNFLLTFTIAPDEILQSAKNSLYPVLEQQTATSLAKATSDSARNFGYFMGLVLIMGFTAKDWIFRSIFDSQKKKNAAWTKNETFLKYRGNLEKLPNASGMIFWVISLFLVVVAAGLLLFAREPMFSPSISFILPMLGWAFVIAATSSFYLDFSMLTSLVDQSKDRLTWKDHIVSVFIKYFVLSNIVMVLSFILGIFSKSSDTSIGALLSSYFVDGMWVYTICVIALMGSVLASASHLFGINCYDQEKARFEGRAVTGADWQRIASCFEPLFVLVVGLAISGIGLESENFVHTWAMLLAILSVLLIAFLKMAEIWGEKSSDIRQGAFAFRRDQLKIQSKKMRSNDELLDYAIELSKLKFFSSRQKLEKLKLTIPNTVLSLDKKNADGKLGEFFKKAERYIFQQDELRPVSAVYPRVNMVFLENGYTFFNEDDPQSQDTISSHFSYLEQQSRIGNRLISMDWLMLEMGLSKDETDSYRSALQCSKSTMPFIIINNEDTTCFSPAIRNALVVHGTIERKHRFEVIGDCFGNDREIYDIAIEKDMQDKVLENLEAKLAEKQYDWLFLDVEVWNAIALMPDIRDGSIALSEKFRECRIVWFGAELEATTMNSLGIYHKECMPFLELTVSEKNEGLEAIFDSVAYQKACSMAEKRFGIAPSVNILINTIDEGELKRFDKLALTQSFVSLALVGTNGTVKIASDREAAIKICVEDISEEQTSRSCDLNFIKTEYKSWNKGHDGDLIEVIKANPYAFAKRAFKSPLKSANGFDKEIITCSLEDVTRAVAYHCGVRGKHSPWNTEFKTAAQIIESWQALLDDINASVKGPLEREVNWIVENHYRK